MRQKGIFLILALVSLVGIFSAIFFDVIQEVEAKKSSGTPNSKFGSAGSPICGDKLCSETESKSMFPSKTQPQLIEKHKASKSVVPSSEFVSQDNEFAEAIQVRFGSGDFTDEIVIDTFGKFGSGKEPTNLIELRKLGFESYFYLESLPSKDKADFYKLISKYINPGQKPQRFDAKISGLMSDGSTIFSLTYSKCNAAGYSIFTQDISIIYQLSLEKDNEIRDKILFYCGGPQIGEIWRPFIEDDNLSKKFLPKEILENDFEKTDSTPVYLVPNENDRAKSIRVHFYDGELEQLYTFDSFKTFSHSTSGGSNPLVFQTTLANPFGNVQFNLESLPSKDKKLYYEFLSRYINPVKPPEKFKVSVDILTGDGTILQRWNYAKCELADYIVELAEFKMRFPFSGQEGPEILDKSEFKCAGQNLQVHGFDEIKQYPISAITLPTTGDSIGYDHKLSENRAMSFNIHHFGGEAEDTYTSADFPRFESLSWKKGSKTPAHHRNQYEHGFFVESNPSKDKFEVYEFLARYINPGKPPEPYDVTVDVVTGDGTILYNLKYTKCSAIDLDWYFQDFVTFYELDKEFPAGETRERFTHYCRGFGVEVP